MATPSITYRTIISLISNWAKEHCANMRSDWNTNGTYAYFRSGSSRTIADTISNCGQGCAIFYLSVNNGISAISQGQVDTDLTDYFTSLGLSQEKWDYPIDNKNLYDFLYNIANFCSFKLCWAATSVPDARGRRTNGGVSTNAGENMTTIEVYSTQAVSGGRMLDPQPEGIENVEIEDAGGTEKKYVVGKTREHTLKGEDIKEMVNSILLNRLDRKISLITYNGTVTGNGW